MEIQRKTIHLGINRVGGQRGFAKTEHRFDLSMESKMYGNAAGKRCIRGSVKPSDTANSQKLSIDSISVREAECTENHTKTQHVAIPRAVGQRASAKTEHRFARSTESNM